MANDAAANMNTTPAAVKLHGFITRSGPVKPAANAVFDRTLEAVQIGGGQ